MGLPAQRPCWRERSYIYSSHAVVVSKRRRAAFLAAPNGFGRTFMSTSIDIARPIRLDVAGVELNGDLALAPNARILIIFAHGSGSSRHSPRNRAVAEVLQHAGMGTLLLDLLT